MCDYFNGMAQKSTSFKDVAIVTIGGSDYRNQFVFMTKKCLNNKGIIIEAKKNVRKKVDNNMKKIKKCCKKWPVIGVKDYA